MYHSSDMVFTLPVKARDHLSSAIPSSNQNRKNLSSRYYETALEREHLVQLFDLVAVDRTNFQLLKNQPLQLHFTGSYIIRPSNA